MREYAATATIKATGEKVGYLYRDSWQARYYSFDGGKTWRRSKAEAFAAAKKQ